jgi:hypothetical protein
VVVQKGKLARLPRWNDVRGAFVPVQDEKLAHAIFSLWWNDFVQDALVLL